MELTSRSPVRRNRYDVVIAGARCAGASTAMLLARMGLRVLVVDPSRRGSDTLSTHALMRGAVLQLHRWGLLEAVRASGTTPIASTTFHYAGETVTIPVKPRDGVDALCAPRRTVLDPILIDAAEVAGAEVVRGRLVVDVLRDGRGRVCGARIGGADERVTDVAAELVIGADGVRSRVARIVEAPLDYAAEHTSASIYAYWRRLPFEGFHWFYDVGAGVGSIPTNDGETCVFASLPRARFERDRKRGLEALYHAALADVSRELAASVKNSDGPGKLRAFAGTPGFLRRAAGPGWVLIGDAGYFRDPITAHGITDAFREAEFLSRAVDRGDDDALTAYQRDRDERVKGLLDVTDRISAFEWSLEDIKQYHLVLSREMKALLDASVFA